MNLPSGEKIALFTLAVWPAMRRYDSLAQREQGEESFYGSDEWRKGPPEAMLALIERYTDIVLEVDEVTVRGLRNKV